MVTSLKLVFFNKNKQPTDCIGVFSIIDVKDRTKLNPKLHDLILKIAVHWHAFKL